MAGVCKAVNRKMGGFEILEKASGGVVVVHR